jgi:beta-glucosidase
MSVDAWKDQLTLEEKAALTSGSEFWYTLGVDRLGIRRVMVSDGPHGLRAQPQGGDHIGLNGSVPATCFPPAATVASSWDPSLVYEVGQAIGQEARAINLSVVLGPGVNIKRSPLCGRNFEYLSEDPYLTGELGVGIVDGIQSKGVGTSLKHFAANNQETDRLRVSAEVSERALREIYLPAFEKVVKKSQPWTVMCSYNKINGVSSSENHWLLTEVLRDEWGFEGLVMSDWGAVYDRVKAAAAGLDLEMPPALPYSPHAIVAAVKNGTLPESVLDERVRAVLRLAEQGAAVLDVDETYDQDAHHALARRVAGESAVLLTNDGLLPIAPGTKVAVIGEFARTARYQGAGSSQVNPTRVMAPLDALSDVYDTTFAPAYTIDSYAPDDALVAEAVAAAAGADTVIMLLGLPGPEESEGFDRTHMDLPANQIAALAAVAAANPNVAVVLVNGSSVVLGDVTTHARALLEAWLGGQAGGGAIADVVSGAVNPSGRLAETLPHRLEDNPSYLNFPGGWQKVLYGEDVFVGYRGYDASHTDVAFPFGYGLSYTSFELSDLDVTTTGSVATNDLAASVSVTVTNTGAVAGSQVAQVYVSDPVASVARPPRELKGFAKVSLDAGASSRVTIELDQRAFSFWLEPLHRWVVEAGDFVIAVGNDSRDLPLARTVTVEAPPVAAPLTVWSSYEEWLADDGGRALLDEAAAAGQPDLRAFGDLVHVIGNFPLMSLTTFVGMSPDHDTVEKMAATWTARDGATT